MVLIQNSTFSLLGIWVTVSFFSGLLVYLLIKIFDGLYPNQSSADRYHKAIAGLVFFFCLNIASTFVFNDHIHNKNEKTFYQEVESVHELAIQSSFSNGIQESKAVKESGKSDFMTSNLIFKSLGVFWLIGAFVFSIKMIGGYYYTRNLIKQYHESIPQKWNKFIQDQLRQLQIGREVKVFESQRITSALTFGFVKPLIALPIGFFTSLPVDQIEAVLLHELYHIKHKDYLINLLTMTFEVIFFYHPLMWWLAKNIRNERENRCDDQVTQITDKQVYAHALLNMESYRQSMNYAIPFSNKQSNLKMRIMRIFEQKPEQNIGLKPFLSLLMVVVFLMGFTFYKLEDPKNEAKQRKTTENRPEIADKLTPQEKEDKILFKSEDSRLGLVLEMTKSTLIAKTENEKVKLYVDGRLYPLNQKIPYGEKDMASMYENKEESAHYFFTRQYFESHNREKWEKENENRDTYIFDRKTEFFIYRPAKDNTSQPTVGSDEEVEEMISETIKPSKSIEKLENKPANVSEINIPGPVQIQFEDGFGLTGDSNNLKVLKKLVKKFGSDENAEVTVKIDGKLINSENDLEKILGKREIRNIRIVLPSENAEIGLIEIITNDIVEMKVKEVAAAETENKTKGINEVPENVSTITISVFYKTNDGDFSGEMKMDAEKESVLEVLGLKSSEILFVIDGEEKRIGYKPTDINPNKIDSISVLKDKKAINKYGKKAKNGVVEIYLKKE